MEDFLQELASRQWRYYKHLYKRKPHAQTSDDCFERIQIKAKYEELLDMIGNLPPKEQTIVETKYKSLTEFPW